MKKIVIGALALALLAGGAYVYLGRGGAAPADTAPAQAAAAVEATDQIVAEAKVVPARGTALSLPSGGAARRY